MPSQLPFSTNTACLKNIKRDFQNSLSFESLGSSGIHCCKKTGITAGESENSLAAEGEVDLL